jgi:hypothetical protein
MVARKLDLNFFAIGIEDPPSDKAFSTNLIGGRKLCDLDVTRGIVRTKIAMAWTDAT